MPHRRLPLELELRILDCAVPPCTYANFSRRSRILRRLSLVHRSWTARAQTHLAEQMQVHSPTRHLLEDIQSALDAGRPTKRLDLVFEWEDINVDGGEPQVHGDIPHMDEISIRRMAGLCERCDGQAMRRMDDLVNYPQADCAYLHHLPSTLRYLSVAHFSVRCEFWPADFRQLDTLLLTDVGPDLDWEEMLDKPSWPLHVLGLKDPAPDLPGRYLARLPPTLAHLAFVGSPGVLIDLTTDLVVPPNLRSLTVVVVSPDERDLSMTAFRTARQSLHEACEDAGVQLNLKECEEKDELNAFDLEEWALTLGG